MGVGRLTRIDAGEPRHMRLTDNRLFDHPWLYATQTGWWGLSDSEVARLREYLLRGGFLVTDDFWGPEQWEIFRRTMDRVFPGRPITDIALTDSVMHVLYDIGEKDLTWIPGTTSRRVGENEQRVGGDGARHERAVVAPKLNGVARRARRGSPDERVEPWCRGPGRHELDVGGGAASQVGVVGDDPGA